MTTKMLPQVHQSALGKVDLSREREWILQHRQEYVGQWVVLDGDRLVGHTADNSLVAALVSQARAEGVRVPYVKFISSESEPIWIGWL